ncbi:DUF2218 domain-containing protein [Methylopila turkensis]|uniref:DUF2218 domain-containing protein n=1 Tax=Methylopila turkensis TaxID=1437816 RepID=A0A9W6N6K0_9HYPH|nr:DUF2218 domain-containing protein [Methylopila turkensis]GLK80334.1 hypothetical protein GCM10008174_20750 [Methylopila turkensis]
MAILDAASVPTANGARYVAQLCKHWSHKLEVEQNGDAARIVLLNDAVVTLAARPEALDLAIEAASPEDLELAKDVLVRHLDRFAFREAPLAYGWRGVDA